MQRWTYLGVFGVVGMFLIAAVAFVPVIAVGGTENPEEEGRGPQLAGPGAAAMELPFFETMDEAYAYAELVIVARAGEFEPWFKAGPDDFSVAEAELEVARVLNGEPADEVRLGLPAGVNYDAVPEINEALEGRQGVYFLISTQERMDRHSFEPTHPDVLDEGNYMLVSSQGAILDGGPDGAYPLRNTENDIHPFPGNTEGQPFDELVEEVRQLAAE